MEQLNTLGKKPIIKVIGIGGGGNNAVSAMSDDDFNNVEFIVANTDAQVLNDSPIENKIILGEKLTQGLGAGTDPSIGKQAAIESTEVIKDELKDADLVFIAAGMGGGTGTGAAPVVAKIAKENGSLVIAVVTTPFEFEGTKRSKNAQAGIEELRKEVDAIVVVSNNRLLELGATIPANDTFLIANNILREGVRAITDLVDVKSHINLDFADVRNILKDSGDAMFGIGIGMGERAANEAAKKAIASPILETSIKGTNDVIINISGGKELGLGQVSEIINTVKQASNNNDLNVVWGMTIRDELKNKVVVTIIATGYKETKSIDDDFELTESSIAQEPDDDFTIEEETFEKTSEPTMVEEPIEENNDDDEEIPSFMK